MRLLPLLLVGLQLLLAAMPLPVLAGESAGSPTGGGSSGTGASPTPNGSPAAVLDPDPRIGQAAQMLAAGRAPDAFALLAPLERVRGGDPEFDYLLALAALQAGRPAAALAPLRRVLQIEPKFDGARMELARALAASGDTAAARREYEWLVRQGGSDLGRQAASRALAALDGARSRPTRRLVTALVAGAGYDSNANASTAGEVFGFVLDPQAVQQSSPIVEVGASLAGEQPLGRLGRGAFQMRAGHRAHPDASFVDQTVLDAGAGVRKRLGAWTVGVGATLARGWLDGVEWFDSGWLEGALSRPLGTRLELVGAGRAIALDYRQSRFEPLDARRFLWGAALQSRERAGDVPRYGIGVIGGRDDARDRDSPWSNDRYGARVYGAWPLDSRRALFAEAAWLTSDFFGARGFFGIDRLDRQVVAAVGFDGRGWPSRGWRVTPLVRWTDNASNVAPFRFDRIEATIYLRREFD